MWPSDDQLRTAWQRLLTDPTAGGPFAELVLPPLEAYLARQFPSVPSDLRTEAADVAVATILRQPRMYDPTRASLPTFLRLIARRDLCNLLVQEKRHQRGRMPWNHVEHSLLARNEEQNDMLWSDYPNLLNVIAAFDDTDRQVFELMKDGERRTAVFAAALGLTDKPADEQIAMVKRAKDRIMARLRRAGGHDE